MKTENNLNLFLGPSETMKPVVKKQFMTEATKLIQKQLARNLLKTKSPKYPQDIHLLGAQQLTSENRPNVKQVSAQQDI